MNHYTTYLSAIGLAVRTERTAKKVSQVGLAAMTGLDRGTIIRIESGKHNVSILTLCNICLCLGVNVWQILPLVTHEREPEALARFWLLLKG